MSSKTTAKIFYLVFMPILHVPALHPRHGGRREAGGADDGGATAAAAAAVGRTAAAGGLHEAAGKCMLAPTQPTTHP